MHTKDGVTPDSEDSSMTQEQAELLPMLVGALGSLAEVVPEHAIQS